MKGWPYWTWDAVFKTHFIQGVNILKSDSPENRYLVVYSKGSHLHGHGHYIHSAVN